MKRIMMEKYGFVREKDWDFSDDGARFTCYSVGDGFMRVRKYVCNNGVYISGRADCEKLPYDVYSKLLHYKDLDRFNGVSLSTITDDDLKKFYEDCLAYVKEYKEAMDKIVYPTYEQLLEKAKSIEEAAKKELADIKNRIDLDKLFLLDDWQLNRFKDCYNRLKESADILSNKEHCNEYLSSILNTVDSIYYINRNITSQSHAYSTCKMYLDEIDKL